MRAFIAVPFADACLGQAGIAEPSIRALHRTPPPIFQVILQVF